MATSSSPTRDRHSYNAQVAPAPTYDALVHALEQSEERYQLLVRRVGIGIFRASVDGRLIEANPALIRMLGYACEAELRSLNVELDLFVNPLDRERLRARLANGPVDRLATCFKRKDGTSLTVRLSVRESLDEYGRVAFYDGLVEDVSERLRQQELLRRSERMACLGATLAGVAHELNNPLAAILGFAQLLLKKDVDDEARLALETIDHEAARAGRIVRDLLTLVRKREVERRVRLNLNDIVGYIVGTRRYALETHGIECITSIDSRTPLVVGDRAQLEQIVLNLLNNAEQAIRSMREDGGQIRIRTRADGSTAVLEVEDNGPGVPADAHEHIWDAFWTTKAPAAGTGLGLTVVRDIVTSHGGDIRVEEVEGSRAPAGARFTVRLPGICGYTSATAAASEAASRALDVLVVDPDIQTASFLTAFLSSRGHAALSAHDFDYAAHLANHLAFDAVICDASIAGARAVFDGFRSASGCASTRFIITAGEAASTAKLQLPLPPATALVMRPYDLEELRVLLED